MLLHRYVHCLLNLSQLVISLMPESWQELIDKMVSSHIHSRKAGNIEQAADTITRLSQAYLAYTDSKKV
jgi:hypothetical protein